MSLNPYCSGQWSRTYIIKLNAIVLAVLILVVMEDGLIHDKKIEDAKEEIVLILVVMEDGLILNAIDRKRGILPRVLILVVMEDGLVQ